MPYTNFISLGYFKEKDISLQDVVAITENKKVSFALLIKFYYNRLD